jgi:XTP/dITP diphosphohydrolase
MLRRVLLATRSAGKLRELQPMFAAAGWVVSDLADFGLAPSPAEERLEVFDTYEENARAKAHYFWSLVRATAVVAEDSGLEVVALGGAPGVLSKRWSGRGDLTGQPLDDANNALLLERLRGVADRRARYVCAAVFWDGHRELVGRGETAGVIAEGRATGAGGFGYDPYFVSGELGRAFSAVPRDVKTEVSHRGRAVAQLLKSLEQRG